MCGYGEYAETVLEVVLPAGKGLVLNREHRIEAKPALHPGRRGLA
jgi:hypothetical protein